MAGICAYADVEARGSNGATGIWHRPSPSEARPAASSVLETLALFFPNGRFVIRLRPLAASTFSDRVVPTAVSPAFTLSLEGCASRAP
jgi:hypothetical protein